MRISNTVHFKHQYITNLVISPESHVAAAAQQLAQAIKGNIPAGNKMAEALKKVQQALHKNSSGKTNSSTGTYREKHTLQ
jgi:hypothetical protein